MTTKATHIVQAKIFPLSAPQELEKQIKNINKNINYLNKFKSDRKKQLQSLQLKIDEQSPQIQSNK